jgi:hypothetical protein
MGYTFEIHGAASILDSRIERVFTSYYWTNGDGGVEVYSSAVEVIGTTFTDVRLNGMMISGCSPTIEDCTFFSCPDDGIEAHEGSPTIVNCTFEDCGWGLVLEDCTAEVRDCTFRRNEIGLAVARSNVTVTGCTFERNSDVSLFWVYGSEVTSEDNTYTGNAQDEVYDRWPETTIVPFVVQVDTMCLPVVMVIAIVSLVPLIVRIRYVQSTGGKHVGWW